ncbi:shikimate dehydrogenase [Clostridium tarantellae]|uniref:Shikimate dehydrogenase (NADP(+)) n=1 Tax=Clostridium tarantellae TaxID=39493 RepID=A0A6I1MQY9_9CLOT|nr:shikimate dehydrogenase [Clostridium tarantellae]MPQ44587.1 shikimate dehydrogenase [Clostridium tarantellae]
MDIFGLIGEKLSHSFSPKIHNPIFKELKINGVYNLFSVNRKNSFDIVNSLKILGVKGVNVTIPYKELVMEQLDYISPEAEKIGAINTILIKDEKSYGYNTDYYGFGKMLEREFIEIKNNSFCVLGAGGAAKSIIHYLNDMEAEKITLVSRDKEKAKVKFSNIDIEVIDYEQLKNIKNIYGVINTTPCGMFPNVDKSAISKEVLKKFKVAIDIIYNPQETLFLKWAKDLGLKVVDGLFMLVGQGVKAEEIWNECNISKKCEESIYLNLLKELNNN